ncbi:MAG: hypothetical protein MK081_01490 [Flavobacteriales bacterium]|nr:hypothetical protein [Flavobacteriales bacterium]
MKRLFLPTLIILAVLFSVLMSSCSAFRKKNRCNTCPVWKDQIEVPTE